MAGIISLGFAFLLALSYRVAGKRSATKASVFYIWGLCALAAVAVVPEQYVFRFPVVDTTVFALAAVPMLTNAIISQYSNYHPTGTTDRIHFIIVYPIAEEIVFRGLLIPILNRSFSRPVVEWFDVPVTLSIVIAASLFAIARLQRYKLNPASVKYMLFAFCGGIVFGVIANSTQSILIPVLLHVEYNLLAVYYSSKMRTD